MPHRPTALFLALLIATGCAKDAASTDTSVGPTSGTSSGTTSNTPGTATGTFGTGTGTATGTSTGTGTGTLVAVPTGSWHLLAEDALPGQDTFDIEITDSGDVYVVYGRVTDDELWAMHSGDGGSTFSPAVRVTNGEVWTHALRDKPYIVSNDVDVHVVFQETLATGFPSILVPTWYSSPAGAGLSFGSAYTPPIDTVSNNWNHFPQLGFRSDGELWLAWISFGTSFDKQGYFARESNGFAPELLPSVQTPCDCCQAHLMTGENGDLFYAWRSEYVDLSGTTLRDPVALIARDGDTAFSEEVTLTTTPWPIIGCPQQGVRMSQAAGVTAAVWADTTDGDYKVWYAQSTDSGVTWTTEEAVAPGLTAHDSPNVAVQDDGAVWVVVDEGGAAKHLVYRGPSASGWSAPYQLASPDGGGLVDPIVESNGGTTAVIAQDDTTDRLWLYVL